jgi:NADH-quinone oxidoreductase subunit L
MLLWIPLLPFAGFLANASVGRRLSRQLSGALASAVMLGSFGVSALAVRALLMRPETDRVIGQNLFIWIASADFQAPFSLRLDPLSALMILVVTGIGFLIHVYSTAYMHEETPSEFARYFSYLNLFAAFMLVLVLGANFLVLFIGWEGVGLCSYLLIGFWYQKRSAADAGKKAFIVNRVGDVAFILGVILAFVRFRSVDFQAIAANLNELAPESTFGTVSVIALLLFVGATGKSAQIPLYVWLPDAMEGPTPVSALIHAATMVTAGVYLIARNSVLFSHAPQVLLIVAIIGAATALWAGLLGLVQNDIKRVLAYSTVSQLGYMFLAMGVGAYAAGIFHLFTHAFFKALLFLGSGAVIHALAGEQDLRNMGGLKRDLPVTYWTFLVGALAIAGVPGLAGFFSKDEILFRVFANGHFWLWVVGSVTSLLTAIYMFRLVFLAFHGSRPSSSHMVSEAQPDVPRSHADHSTHLHDAPRAMAFALIVLAIGSVLAGYLGVPDALGGTDKLGHFLAAAMPEPAELAASRAAPETSEIPLMLVATAVSLAGIGVAFYVYRVRPQTASQLADRIPGLYRFLLNKGYVDELYDEVIVEPTKALAEGVLWRAVDATIIDGAVNGTATIVGETGGALRKVQTGSMRTYALSVLLGVVAIVGYFLWR